MNSTRKTVGDSIIDAIVKQGLVQHVPDSPGVLVWKAETAEALGDAVRQYLHESDVAGQARKLLELVEELPGSSEASACSLAASNLAHSLEGAWSPGKDGLTLGEALEALKEGAHVARKGWNGVGMRLFMLPAAHVPKAAIYDPALRKLMDEQIEGDTFEALPTIRMFTADKKVLTGWLASQSDMFAEDYYILEA
jgi:hypothetical protein